MLLASSLLTSACSKPSAASPGAEVSAPSAASSSAPEVASSRAGSATPRPPPAANAAAGWRYQVAFAAGVLAVEAQFDSTRDGTLSADDSLATYFSGLEVAQESSWVVVKQRSSGWVVPCAAGCRVRYRFALERAARELNDADSALAAGDVFISPPSSWLLHPNSISKTAYFELRVDPGATAHFVTAFEPLSGIPGAYRAPASALDDASFSAFGGLQVMEVPAGDATVQLGVAPDRLGLSAAQARDWISASAGAVASYYHGHLPARHTLVLLTKGSGRNTRGETLGGGGAAVLVQASDLVNPSTTRDDWVVTHELLHANFPDVGRRHAWLSEGLSTYVEPVARSRVGLVSEQKFWRDLWEGLPQGLPQPGDQGLEHTRTWGRTYWGGALFCLMVDVNLREKTGNRHSLDDVLLAIGKTGDTDDTSWDIQQVLDAGDRATGTTVLHDQYEELAQKPGTVDLSSLFARLGVAVRAGTVVFDDAAPLAKIRRSITARGPG